MLMSKTPDVAVFAIGVQAQTIPEFHYSGKVVPFSNFTVSTDARPTRPSLSVWEIRNYSQFFAPQVEGHTVKLPLYPRHVQSMSILNICGS